MSVREGCLENHCFDCHHCHDWRVVTQFLEMFKPIGIGIVETGFFYSRSPCCWDASFFLVIKTVGLVSAGFTNYYDLLCLFSSQCDAFLISDRFNALKRYFWKAFVHFLSIWSILSFLLSDLDNLYQHAKSPEADTLFSFCWMTINHMQLSAVLLLTVKEVFKLYIWLSSSPFNLPYCPKQKECRENEQHIVLGTIS
jgi:hypothetical protein